MSTRRLVTRFLLAAGATAITCLLLEGAVRALKLAPPPWPVLAGQATRPTEDRVLKFENKPDAIRTITYVDAPGAEPRVVTMTTNRHGLRGQAEVRVGKAPGTFRIACVGDSYTYGHGVDDDDTWPYQLSTLLRADADESSVEVINFGVSAYDTVQEVHQIRTKVLDFAPDLVLLGWFFNDTSVHGGAGADRREMPFLVRTLSRKNEGWIKELRDRSHFAELVCRRVYRHSFQQYFVATRTDTYDAETRGWQRATKALGNAKKLLDKRGVPFLLVLFPTLYRDGDHLGSHEAYEKVKAFCRDISLPTLDLEPEFLDEELSSLWVHYTDDHPNGAAYRIAADAIRTFLFEQGVLPFERAP